MSGAPLSPTQVRGLQQCQDRGSAYPLGPSAVLLQGKGDGCVQQPPARLHQIEVNDVGLVEANQRVLGQTARVN